MRGGLRMKHVMLFLVLALASDPLKADGIAEGDIGSAEAKQVYAQIEAASQRLLHVLQSIDPRNVSVDYKDGKRIETSIERAKRAAAGAKTTAGRLMDVQSSSEVVSLLIAVEDCELFLDTLDQALEVAYLRGEASPTGPSDPTDKTLKQILDWKELLLSVSDIVDPRLATLAYTSVVRLEDDLVQCAQKQRP
jgi:hypothetical protein